MSPTTLRHIAERICTSRYVREHLAVVWHAGEPLVLPVGFYEEAFAILDEARPSDLQLDHSFQSNGILLDETWIRFIRERGVRIGISIDGPRRFHDRYRVTRGGHGTYDRTLAGIERLQAADLDFHVITVLTADALGAPDEFFDFYIEHGIRHVGFNIEEIEGAHPASSLQAPGMSEAYARFMRRIMERLRTHPPGILTVRELASGVAMIGDPNLELRGNEQVEPLAIVSIDTEGNISTFSPELLGIANDQYSDFAFGNVHRHGLDDVLADPAFRRADAAIREGVRRCAESCAYFDFCRGGAPANKLFENGDFASTETLYCRLNKQILFDVILEDLERSLGLSRKVA